MTIQVEIYKVELQKYVLSQSNFTYAIIMYDISSSVLQEQLEHLNEYKTKMLASVSHELRTPLNCTVSMHEQLKGLVAKKIWREYLLPSLNSCKLLLLLINDILDLAQINAGKFTFIFTKFKLRTLIIQTYKLFSIQAKIKNLELKLEYDDDIPKYIYSDPNRLRQIIANLFGTL